MNGKRNLTVDTSRPHNGFVNRFNSIPKASPEEPPEVTPLLFPLDFADEIIEHPITREESSDDSGGPPTPPDSVYFHRLWQDVRDAKERGFKPVPLASPPRAPSPRQPPPRRSTPKPPQLEKKKSIVSTVESADGRTATTTFDMTGVDKDAMHVSFHPGRLVVTWRTITVSEKEEGGRLVRELKEKQYSHMLPLPEGTKFDAVNAIRDGKRLTLKYPAMHQTHREPRPSTSRKTSDGSNFSRRKP